MALTRWSWDAVEESSDDCNVRPPQGLVVAQGQAEEQVYLAA